VQLKRSSIVQSCNSSKKLPKRTLVIDYSRDMLTIEKLIKNEGSSSKKRKHSEVTGELAAILQPKNVNVEQEKQADELSGMMQKMLNITEAVAEPSV